jgi:uncharacterized SAM-binding protein YcdF (DUF218 family)
MFFALKKICSFFLMPLQFSVLLMLLGLVLAAFTRRARLGRGLILAGLGLLLILSNKQVGMALLLPLETRYPAIPELSVGATLPPELASCRAIVVLGGGHSDTPGLADSHLLSTSALARIAEGVRLARLLPGVKVLCTGPGSVDRSSHAALLAGTARALGLEADRLQLLDSARDTEQEARTLKAALGSEPFALVTSAWHMPRAIALMRRQGLAPLPCPADFGARPNPDFRWNDWTCDLSGLERSTKAVYERIGFLWLWLRGKA